MLAVEWLIGTASTIYLVSLVAGLVSGRLSIRDERGRPKAVPAALLSLAFLLLVGLLGTAIFE